MFRRSAARELRKALWVEFAGLAAARGSVGKKYRAKLNRKQKLAAEAGLRWLAITPEDLREDHLRVWQRMVKLAPWLRRHEQAALRSRNLGRLRGLPGEKAIPYASRKRKHTTDSLLQAIKERIEKGLPLYIYACEQDDEFKARFQTIRKRSDTSNSQWWSEWLIRAGMPRREALAAARKHRQHKSDPGSVAPRKAGAVELIEKATGRGFPRSRQREGVGDERDD